MTARFWTHLSLILLAVVPMACGPKGETASVAETTASRVLPVRVAPITVRTVERVRDVVGNLKGWDEVTIGAKRAGRVAKIDHDMGDRVKPGELLVELETIDTDLSVDQAQKRLDVDLAKLGLKKMPEKTFDISTVPTVVQAKVALDRARLNLGRERTLMSKGAGTGQDFQNAENDEQSASAAYENARLVADSTLASALASKVALDVANQVRVDLRIKAPEPSKKPPGLNSSVSYAVARRAVSEGQMVREADPLFDLVIDNPLRLWCNVPEVYASAIALGQEVRISVISHPGKIYPGKVNKINPAVDPASRTFQVEALVPNDQRELRPGGFAKVQIVTNTQDKAVTVPPEAVVKLAGVTKVYVITDDNLAKTYEVETATEGDGWIEVVGKLPTSGRVAIEGVTKLAEGTKVRIQAPVDPVVQAAKVGGRKPVAPEASTEAESKDKPAAPTEPPAKK